MFGQGNLRMAYSYEWLGTDTKILSIGFSGSITNNDIDQIRVEFQPVLEKKEPLLVLADFGDVNIAQAPMQQLRLVDGVPTEILTYHANQSHLAILGGGYAISMVLKMFTSLLQDNDAARQFSRRSQAIDWLTAESQTSTI